MSLVVKNAFRYPLSKQREVHDTPEHVVIDVVCRQRGVRTTLVSPLHPDYVRPDNTLDDRL